MGHRQDLLEAAKRRLAEQGYASITARDLVATSGTNLASIGYHFGSKDALLMAAIIDVFDGWDGIDHAVAALADGTPADRLQTFIDGLITALEAEPHYVAASLHALARSEDEPAARRRIVDAYEQARRGFAALVLDQEPDRIDEHAVHTVGSLGLAIVNGVVVQWLLDPATAPSGAAVVDAIRALAPSVTPGVDEP